MPEGYTHFRIAAKAAAAVRYKIKWPAAFAAGANGPDVFFCYEIWRRAKKRRYDLPALGTRMHEENTGAFLMELVRGAHTGPQAEYVLGFLSHYAADVLIHPYVAALCQPGMPYAGKGGHGYFEIALDSTLHKEDTGNAAVPAVEACPTPEGEALAEIVALVRAALQKTYGLDIPAEYIADSFFHSTKLRGLFTSRFGVRRAFFWLIEPLFGGRGKITGHVSPRKLKADLPDLWQDPFTGAERHGDAFALMAQAQAESEKYMAAAILFWTRRAPSQTLAELLGSASYSEGRPTPRSDPGYTAPAEPRPAAREDASAPAAAADAEPQPPMPPRGTQPEPPAQTPAAPLPGPAAGKDEPPAPAVQPFAVPAAAETAPAAMEEPPAAPAASALSEEQQQELLAEGLALIAAAREDTPAPEEASAPADTPAPADADAEPQAPAEAPPAPEEISVPADVPAPADAETEGQAPVEALPALEANPAPETVPTAPPAAPAQTMEGE